MSFERTKTKKSGRKYRELVESYWDPVKKAPRQKVIKYLGVVDENGGNKVKPPSRKMDQVEKAIPIGTIALYYMAAKEIGLLEVLKQYFPDYYLSMIALIFNQLCKRQSLEKAAKWFNNVPISKWEGYKVCDLNRNDLDEALNQICFIDNGVKIDKGLTIQNEMSGRCQSKYTTGRKYLFYDVTKITYYGYKCDYSKKGYIPKSRGRRTIGLGFVTTKDDGFPIRCCAIPGSKNDTITMEDMIFALNSWGHKGLLLIIDRGMMSERNIKMARENGFHIISCCPETSNDVEKAITLLNDDEICRWENAIKRPSGEIVYVKGRKGVLYGQEGLLVVVLDPKLKALEKSNRDIMVKDLKETNDKKIIKELKRTLAPIIVKSKGRRGFKIDYDLVKKEEHKDGRYLMFCMDRRLSAKRVFTTYFQRDEIEKVFKCLKGELSLGPIRYQRVERIDAYMTIVFLAYLLRSIVNYKLSSKSIDMSVEEVIEELKSITLIEYSYKDKKRSKISRLSEKQLELSKALDLEILLPSADNHKN